MNARFIFFLNTFLLSALFVAWRSVPIFYFPHQNTMADVEEALNDALDDVQSRFLLNLPANELSSADRIFFQLEQAHWYYEVRSAESRVAKCEILTLPTLP